MERLLITLNCITRTRTLRFQNFLDELREVEKLLGKQYMREQFIYSCIPRSEAYMFDSWKGHLRGLRWEVISEFCGEEPCPNDCFFHTDFFLLIVYGLVGEISLINLWLVEH